MEDMNTYKNINRRRGCKGVARILLCAAFLISHFIDLLFRRPYRQDEF